MNSINSCFLGLVLSGSSLCASPITILDNSVPNTPPDFYQLVGQNDVINEWMGAEFSVSQTTTISSIQAWMYGAAFGSANSTMGTFSVNIYTDLLQAPGTNIFSQSFTAMDTLGWNGLAGGDLLTLNDGSYWVTFDGDSQNQGFIGMYANVPQTPQVASYNFGDSWSPLESGVMDISILGIAAPQSVPDGISTLSLLGEILLGFAAYRLSAFLRNSRLQKTDSI
jgi:hypothetical protein